MFIQLHNFGNDIQIRYGKVRNRIYNSDDHLHQYFELIMVLDGEIEITVEGKTVTAKNGDIAIIPAFRIHSFHTPEIVSQLVCVFPAFFLNESFSSSLLNTPRESHIFRPSAPLWDYLVASGFSEMGGHYALDRERDINHINCFSATLHMIMAEYYSKVPVSDKQGYDETLSKILQYMSTHYTEDLSLESVGDALGYSPKYVSNRLSAIKGIGFRQLLNCMRVERAKQLLISTSESNYEISLASGFNSECSLHRAFKKFVGCTPAQYRGKSGAKPSK